MNKSETNIVGDELTKLSRLAVGAKWKKDLINRLETLSNAELFDEFMDAQQPDDYDGGFTSRGSFEKDIYIAVIRYRLADWLTK
jgi:hypothetical protein